MTETDFQKGFKAALEVIAVGIEKGGEDILDAPDVIDWIRSLDPLTEEQYKTGHLNWEPKND